MSLSLIIQLFIIGSASMPLIILILTSDRLPFWNLTKKELDDIHKRQNHEVVK